MTAGVFLSMTTMAAGGISTGCFSHEMPRSTNERPTNPRHAEMAADFRDPFGKVSTGAYWYWLSGNVSQKGVERDLIEMKRVGIDRAYIGDIRDAQTPPGKIRTFSPEWERALATAFAKASELGIDIGLFNSPGWSMSGGPWVSYDKAMRRLAVGETVVTGPCRGPIRLPLPNLGGRATNECQDVAVIAYPTPPGRSSVLSRRGEFRPDDRGRLCIEFATNAPFLAQSVRMIPNPGRFKGHVSVDCLSNGVFVCVGEFAFSRKNEWLSHGFLPQAPVIGAFRPVSSSRFRVTVTGDAALSLAAVELCSAPGVHHAYEKSLAKMFDAGQPRWGEYLWAVPQEEAANSAFDVTRAVDVTGKLRLDGCLDWDVPTGEWTLFRYVMVPTGTMNSPANPEATGYEVDKMNSEHVAFHFDNYLAKIIGRTEPENRKAIKFAILDSYEQGGQTATDRFASKFKTSFGYDPTPFYPACFGCAVGSRDASDRFLWDLRRFVADEVAYSYVGGFRKVAGRNGLSVWLENYGHDGFTAEFLQYGGQADGVGGEFWSNERPGQWCSTYGEVENRAASSCGHTYGKRLIWSESCTCEGLQFQSGPMDLKTRIDRYFAEGVNATILHVYIHQPDERMPGLIAWFGNEFNRHNTWFRHFDLFTGYLKRCGYLLRQGLNVADIAYFIGEDTPKMTGITDPPPPPGRQFDYINAEVLCETAGVDEKGRVVLPHGTAYEVLVLPPLETMRPRMAECLERLVNAGAFVLGPKPVRSPSLTGQPVSDAMVKAIAERLWGEVDGKSVKVARRGKGTVAWGLSLEECLKRRGSSEDFVADPKFHLAFAHRTMPNADIYFVTSMDGKPVPITEMSFRTAGRIPELWDAATGDVRPVDEWRAEGGRTIIRLSLAARESMFVVFAKDAGMTVAGKHRPKMEISEITSPWTISFQSDAIHRGPADPVPCDKLFDLSTSVEPNIRHYSGVLTYRTSFALDACKLNGRVVLDLGKVEVSAKVKVNGRFAGGVCFAPYRIDVTEYVKSGENELEVEVCNLWANRLIGDSEDSARPTWTSVRVAFPRDRLFPSGLIGPVQIVCLEAAGNE